MRKVAQQHKCKAVPKQLVKNRLAALRRAKRDAKGIMRGISAELLQTIFERATRMLSGDQLPS